MDDLGLHLWPQVRSARWAIIATRGHHLFDRLNLRQRRAHQAAESALQHRTPPLRARGGVDAKHEGALLQLDVAEDHRSVHHRDVPQESLFTPGRRTRSRGLAELDPEGRALPAQLLQFIQAKGHRFRRGGRCQGEGYLVKDNLVALAVVQARLVKPKARGRTSKSHAVVNSGASRCRSSSVPTYPEGVAAARLRLFPRGRPPSTRPKPSWRALVRRSDPSSVKARSPPARTRWSPCSTIRAPMRSQGFRLCVAERSLTSTGSPPRIRSRARKDCPGVRSLTS